MGVCETSLRADKSKKGKIRGRLNLIYSHRSVAAACWRPSVALSLDDDVILPVFAKCQYQNRTELWTMDQRVHPGITNGEPITGETGWEATVVSLTALMNSREIRVKQHLFWTVLLLSNCLLLV